MLAAAIFFLFALQGESSPVLGSLKPPAVPHWYEQVSGILAIPIALVGGSYSFMLIRKTSLESKKLAFELQEKIDAKRANTPAEGLLKRPEEHHEEAIAETLVNRQYSVLLLRYVVMELALRVYNGITAPINWAESLSLGGLYALHGGHLGSGLASILSGAQQIVGTIISAGYWLLFLLLGWPLFKDVNAVLGIDLHDYTPRAVFRGLLRKKTS